MMLRNKTDFKHERKRKSLAVSRFSFVSSCAAEEAFTPYLKSRSFFEEVSIDTKIRVLICFQSINIQPENHLAINSLCNI